MRNVKQERKLKDEAYNFRDRKCSCYGMLQYMLCIFRWRQTLLVDAGGGNQILKRLKDAGIPLSQIHDIFITHEHIDHLLGLIWLVRMIGQNMNKGKYEGNLNIYCH